MFDLIILTQSLQAYNKSTAAGNQSERETTVSLQIFPTLDYHDLQFLTEQTHFFKVSYSIISQHKILDLFQ